MSRKVFLFSIFAIILVFPSLQVPGASAQTDTGTKWKVTVTWEHKGTDSDPYFFQSISGILRPDPAMPGSSFLIGNGTGTWQWRDPQTEQCPPYSGSGAFPAAISAIVGEVPSAETRQLSIGLQAVPGRSLAEFEDFEKRYTVTCHSPPDYVFDEDRSSAPVPLLPQVILKGNNSYWYGEEVGVQTDCCVSKFTVTLSPPDIKFRVYGTVKDIRNPMSESKVVLGDIRTISGGLLPLQMLSASTPDFADETTASADTGAYEFEVEGTASDPPQLVIASLLWYDGDSKFAVTNGQQVSGRYVPVYQAACVSDLASGCIKWERVGDGFEAEVDIQYGFASAEQHLKTILPEAWNLGSRSMGLMAADAAFIYYNSYRALKYFESLQEQVGMPLRPVMIDIYDSHLPGCKNDDGTPKSNAFFDYQAKSPFGRLGSYLEQTAAEGGTVTICTLDSYKSQPDAPINREYHELGHYLHNDMYSPASNLVPSRGTPHAGYANDGTNDSFVEGFAEFTALLVAERYNQLQNGQPMYPVGTHKFNLELDYKVWGDIVRMFRLVDGRIVPYYNPERPDAEEFAAAGLLWDLHDSGQESHDLHLTSAHDDPTPILSPLSQTYNVTRDGVSLFDHHILDNIRSKKPMNLIDLYGAFSGDVSRQDLDMIFINHGAFGDISKRDLVHGTGELVGPTGSSESPERPVRSSPPPKLNGSYISTETNAIFEVKFSHEEPYSFYDYSYILNMTKGEPAYFGMAPSYYPSVAQFIPISQDGKLSGDSSLTINSTDYWNYIYSNPDEKAIFKTIKTITGQETVVPISGPENTTGSTSSQPSGCLIATAAFGSELTPQVQFLRNFRDNHILSTASGASFMNVFNAWYYSFSPQVADYERQQPWLQQTVRIAIYPLLGILQMAEKAYAILPGEFGSISAGLVASSLIGSVYLTPIALLSRRVRESKIDFRILLAIAGSAALAVIMSVMVGHQPAMMVTTSILVVSMLVVATLLTSRIVSSIARRLNSRI